MDSKTNCIFLQNDISSLRQSPTSVNSVYGSDPAAADAAPAAGLPRHGAAATRRAEEGGRQDH